MPRRFQRWGILAVLLLLVSSAVGLVVRGVVQPKSEYQNYNYTTVPRPASTPPVQYRTDLVSGPQPFNSQRKPTSSDQSEFASKIEAFQNEATGDGCVRNHCDTERMAEEWVRFGASQLRNQTPTSDTLQIDAFRIAMHLIPGGPTGLTLFQGTKQSKVVILSVAHSMTGADAWVLAKHTASENGVKHSWQARWWFTQKFGNWSIYDFEPQPHRLRFNALLAGIETLRYRGMESKRIADEVRQRYVLELCDEFARITSREWDRYETTPGTAGFQAEIEYLPMLEAARKYVHFQKTRKGKPLNALNQIAGLWPDSPVAWFAGARTDKMNPYRQHPWSVVLDARTQYFAKKPEAGLQLLRTALDESPGQVDLLAELCRHLPASQHAEVGEWAAKSPNPAASVAAVFEEIAGGKYEAGLSSVIRAYREIRPDEPIGLAIASAQATRDGKLADARAMLKAAHEPAETRNAVAAVFAAEMLAGNCSGDGLRTATGISPRVFQCLMSRLDSGLQEQLGVLSDRPRPLGAADALAIVEKDFAADPWHRYYRARILMENEQYADAEKILTTLLQGLKTTNPWRDPDRSARRPNQQFQRLPLINDSEARGQFHAAHAECLNKLDRHGEAPLPEAAERLIRDGKTQELRDLVKARPAGPDDAFWRGRIAFAEQRYSDAIRYYSEYTTDTVATSLTLTDGRILVEELVRAYLRTSDFQQAKKTLDWYYDGSETMLRLMIALNLQRNTTGDAKKFLVIYLAKAGDQAGRDALAKDPDLGPLLAKPKFQNFLK